MQMTPSPIGPHPTTIAGVLLPISLRRTACRATANGSVSTAVSGGRPFGTANAIDSSTASRSA